MKILKLLTLAVALALPSLAAQAAPRSGGPTPQPGFALFCEGPYALCIKAPCVPVVNANGSVSTVVCSCTVEQGWSMGPAECAKRRPVKHGSSTHLMSTYSNYYNDQEQNLTCKNEKQQWANCYGAPCISDDSEPDRAHCNCPVRTGEMVTLGGRCDKGNCSKMWSAARPKENTFANNNFYNYMKTNHPNYPAKPPAKVCGAI